MTNELTSGRPALGLYIHIPWCHTRCVYCDFNTYIDGEAGLQQRYQEALAREIREAGAVLERPDLHTVFFGGGTPTTLEPQALITILDTVRASFRVDPTAEITVEGNPGTVDVHYLCYLREGGVNRLSLGVQSFHDDELRALSRIHDAATAREAISNARKAGFENLNLDLIFNLPGQSLERWQENIREAIRLGADHLACYSLIVEPGTPLERQILKGESVSPDDDLAADMYDQTVTMLAEAGYTHYETSNWARSLNEADWESPRLGSAHNLIYWRNQPYLGVGAGAYSTFNGSRWANVRRPQHYIDAVSTGAGLALARDPKRVEVIDQPTAMTEHIMLALRLIREGLSVQAFDQRFGGSFVESYQQAIVQGISRGLTEWVESPDGARLRLTAHGRFLANEAIVPFVP